ncbi:MAG TPA: hypothetical protein VNC61_03445 [Acidimicrobiales bacterium]|nr:hypothetical protein [Acidimicrobiales bacterium]
MGGTTTFAEVAEEVRAVRAVYTQALDGRTDDVVATFCPDGGWRFHRRAAAFVQPESRREAG